MIKRTIAVALLVITQSYAMNQLSRNTLEMVRMVKAVESWRQGDLRLKGRDGRDIVVPRDTLTQEKDEVKRIEAMASCKGSASDKIDKYEALLMDEAYINPVMQTRLHFEERDPYNWFAAYSNEGLLVIQPGNPAGTTAEKIQHIANQTLDGKGIWQLGNDEWELFGLYVNYRENPQFDASLLSDNVRRMLAALDIAVDQETGVIGAVNPFLVQMPAAPVRRLAPQQEFNMQVPMGGIENPL